MSFAPEIVFLQATFKAIFVLVVVLAWASHRKVLAGAIMVLSLLPALTLFSASMPSGSLVGGALLWMGEFPLFALVLCLALPLGFPAGLLALLPGIIAGLTINLWQPLGASLVDIQLQFLHTMATQASTAIDMPTRAQLWESLGIQSGLSAASGFLAATFALLWLGRKNGMGRISLSRSIGPLAKLVFPQWPIWGVAASLLLLALQRIQLQSWSLCLALFCGAFYLVRGMSVWSSASVGRLRGNLLWLLALTGTILFFPQLFLVATIAIGLLDQWFLLRERLNPSIGENP